MNELVYQIKEKAKDIDFFCETPCLFYNRQRNFGTVFGSFLSVILVILVCFQVSSLWTQFFSNYGTVTSSFYVYSSDPSFLSLDSDQFSLGIGIYIGDSNMPLDQSLFGVTFSQKICPFSGNCTYVDLGTRPCPQNDGVLKYFKNSSNNELFCSQNQTYNFSGRSLGEYLDGYSSQSIEVNIVPCQNNTIPGVVCLPQSQIDSVLNNPSSDIKVLAFYTNQYFDSNSQDIINRYLDFSGGAWPIQFQQIIDIFVGQTEISINQGWILDDVTNTYMYSIDSQFEDSELRTMGPGMSYYRFNFKRSPANNIQVANFLKVAEAVALTGGYTKAVFAVLQFCALAYNRNKYKVKISNALYEFRDFKEKVKKYTKKSKKGQIVNEASLNIELMNNSYQASSSITQPAQEVSDYYNKIFSKKKYPDEPLVFTFKDWLRRMFCRCYSSPHKKAVKVAHDLAAQAIDIVHVLKQLEQIEYLKDVLLTKDQKLMMDYIPKKIIQESDYKKSEEPRARIRSNSVLPKNLNSEFVERHVEVLSDKYSFDSYENLYFSYLALKRVKSPENEKLLQMMDRELVEVFEDITQYLEPYPNDDEKRLMFKQFHSGLTRMKTLRSLTPVIENSDENINTE